MEGLRFEAPEGWLVDVDEIIGDPVLGGVSVGAPLLVARVLAESARHLASAGRMGKGRRSVALGSGEERLHGLG